MVYGCRYSGPISNKRKVRRHIPRYALLLSIFNQDKGICLLVGEMNGPDDVLDLLAVDFGADLDIGSLTVGIRLFPLRTRTDRS